MSDTQERLISADDHADLSHDAVKRFLDPKFHDAYEAGVAEFRAGMGATASVASNNRWREQHPELDDGGPVGMGANRNHPAFGRPGHTDPVARLEDMDTDGVDASVTFCEVSAFRYLYLIKDGWQEATRAFNLALQEFASPAPHRLIVNPQIPIHDIDAAVAEVEWAAGAGFKSIQMPVFPAELGLPDYWDSRYDALWSAITAVDLPITFHIGMNTALEAIALRDPTPQKGIFVPQVAMSTGEAYGHLVLTGLLARFPDLRIVFVEPGIGWSAWWLFIADDFVLRQGYTFPGLTELPSHYFRQNINLTFIDEPNVVRYAHERLGIENVLWSSDYPHPVSSWPKSRHVVDEMFANDSAEDRKLVVSGNAERIWKI